MFRVSTSLAYHLMLLQWKVLHLQTFAESENISGRNQNGKLVLVLGGFRGTTEASQDVVSTPKDQDDAVFFP